MSIGYSTQKGLSNSNPMRRWSQQVSYTTPPTPPGNNRRTGSAAILVSQTFVPTATAALSTTIYKFGTGSANLSAASAQTSKTSYNPTSTGAATAPGGWPTGTGDYCIESWVYVPNTRPSGEDGDFCCLDTTGGFAIRFGNGYGSNNFNYIQTFARGSSDMDYAAYTWPIDTWVHWAVQRKSGNVTFWANGNKLTVSGGTGAGAYSYTTNTGTLVFGSYQNNTADEDIRLYMDEVCCSSSWRYDDAYSTYNVPTAPFTVDSYTRLLLHFDGSWASAST